MVRKITPSKIIGLYLNDYNRRYYLRELACLLKKSHQTIKPYLKTLIKGEVLIENKRKNITEYNLNFKNKKIYDYLTIAEKEKLIRRLEQDTLLKILFEKLSIYFQDNTFIIFGSAVDKTKNKSDIDLLVIGKKKCKQIKNFEEIYNKKIHKIQITNIEKLTSTLIKEIFKKHLILNNTEQIVRFFGGLHEQNKLV